MTKQEKITILEKPSFAYYSGFGGIEIKDIEYSIDDHIIFVANAWYGVKTVHKAKIYYSNTDNDYFRFKNHTKRISKITK